MCLKLQPFWLDNEKSVYSKGLQLEGRTNVLTVEVTVYRYYLAKKMLADVS